MGSLPPHPFKKKMQDNGWNYRFRGYSPWIRTWGRKRLLKSVGIFPVVSASLGRGLGGGTGMALGAAPGCWQEGGGDKRQRFGGRPPCVNHQQVCAAFHPGERSHVSSFSLGGSFPCNSDTWPGPWNHPSRVPPSSWRGFSNTAAVGIAPSPKMTPRAAPAPFPEEMSPLCRRGDRLSPCLQVQETPSIAANNQQDFIPPALPTGTITVDLLVIPWVRFNFHWLATSAIVMLNVAFLQYLFMFFSSVPHTFIEMISYTYIFTSDHSDGCIFWCQFLSWIFYERYSDESEN